MRKHTPYRIPVRLSRTHSSSDSDSDSHSAESNLVDLFTTSQQTENIMSTPHNAALQHKELDSQKLNFLSSTIPPFDGSEIELTQFLESVETFLIALDLPLPTDIQSRLLINVIKSKLRGQAKVLVLGRPEINTWQEIRNLLVQNFSDHKSLQTWQNEICLLQRDIRETLHDFCNKILGMRSKIVQKIQLLYNDPQERASLQSVYTSLLLNKLKSNLPQNFETIILSRPDLNDIESVVQAILELETYFEYKNMNRRIPQNQPQKLNLPPRQNLPPKPSNYRSFQPQNFLPRQFPSSTPQRQFPPSQQFQKQPQLPPKPSYSQQRPMLPPRQIQNQQPRSINRFQPEPMDTSGTSITKFQNVPRNFQHQHHCQEYEIENLDSEDYDCEEANEYFDQTDENLDYEPENFPKLASKDDTDK